MFLAATWKEKKDLALLCSQPHFTLLSKSQIPPSPPPRIRLWIYAYVVFVCVFLKLQIFIKTASMLELTMLHIQEQACIPHQSVIPKEQCQLIFIAVVRHMDESNVQEKWFVLAYPSEYSPSWRGEHGCRSMRPAHHTHHHSSLEVGSGYENSKPSHSDIFPLARFHLLKVL